jgi:hypothetical protein
MVNKLYIFSIMGNSNGNDDIMDIIKFSLVVKDSNKEKNILEKTFKFNVIL